MQVLFSANLSMRSTIKPSNMAKPTILLIAGAWHRSEYFGPPPPHDPIASLDRPSVGVSPPASDFRCDRNNIWRSRRSIRTGDVMVKTEFGHNDV